MGHTSKEETNAYLRAWKKAKRCEDPEWVEREAAYRRTYYANNRERMIAKQVAYKNRHPVTSRIRSTKSDAAKRGLEYALDPRLATDLVTDNCFYCGAAPLPVNGIDRVDNSRGYHHDNVVSCCPLCNVAKNDNTVDAFIGWIYRAQAHQERVNA